MKTQLFSDIHLEIESFELPDIGTDIAARNARIIWTLMVKQEDYKVIPV